MRTPDFSELREHIEAWDLPTIEARLAKRASSTLEELQRFHDAMLPRLAEIIDFLNQFPPGQIPERHQPLRNAALAMLHVDRPVNRWRRVVLDDALDPRRFVAKSSFYDSQAPET